MDKIEYRINIPQNCVFLRLKGEINIDEIIEYSVRINKETVSGNGMDAVIDLSEARLNLNFQNAINLYNHLKSVEVDISGCKWAIIAPQDINYGLIRMFTMICEHYYVQIMPFRSEEDALSWLGLSTRNDIYAKRDNQLIGI